MALLAALALAGLTTLRLLLVAMLIAWILLLLLLVVHSASCRTAQCNACASVIAHSRADSRTFCRVLTRINFWFCVFCVHRCYWGRRFSMNAISMHKALSAEWPG